MCTMLLEGVCVPFKDLKLPLFEDTCQNFNFGYGAVSLMALLFLCK